MAITYLYFRFEALREYEKEEKGYEVLPSYASGVSQALLLPEALGELSIMP